MSTVCQTGYIVLFDLTLNVVPVLYSTPSKAQDLNILFSGGVNVDVGRLNLPYSSVSISSISSELPLEFIDILNGPILSNGVSIISITKTILAISFTPESCCNGVTPS